MTTKHGGFTIRPVAADDAEAVAEMAQELSAHEGAPPPLVLPHDIRVELERPDCVLFGFIALAGSDPVGYALHSIVFDTESGARGAYLCDLYVKAKARRNGLARTLVQAVARDAAARGGSWVSWGALANNAEAQTFYPTMGKVDEGVELWSMSNTLFARLTRTAEGPTD